MKPVPWLFAEMGRTERGGPHSHVSTFEATAPRDLRCWELRVSTAGAFAFRLQVQVGTWVSDWYPLEADFMNPLHAHPPEPLDIGKGSVVRVEVAWSKDAPQLGAVCEVFA